MHVSSLYLVVVVVVGEVDQDQGQNKTRGPFWCILLLSDNVILKQFHCNYFIVAL